MPPASRWSRATCCSAAPAAAGRWPLSAAINPRLALASGLAFFFSELADFAVYTPLQRRYFLGAVVASGIVGSIVDSVLFLQVAGIPLGAALPGLLLGKVWVQLAAVPLLAWVRGRIPLAQTA